MTGMIDLSRVPAPNAIEDLDENVLFEQFKTIFIDQWAAIRAANPEFPQYDVEMLDSDTAMILGQAFSGSRHLDRQRVNDGIKGLLAPLAEKEDLVNIVASQNIEPLIVIPATDDTDAVYENDAQLLRRYLLSFDRPAAGSRGRYLYDAYSAYPNLLDARVNGFEVHGRRGDVDILIVDQGGVHVSEDNKQLITETIRHENALFDGISVSILDAPLLPYDIDLTIVVPGNGPEPELVRLEAEARVRNAAASRILINGQIKDNLLSGAANGQSVLKVIDHAPVNIDPDPYLVPVPRNISVKAEVAS